MPRSADDAHHPAGPPQATPEAGRGAASAPEPTQSGRSRVASTAADRLQAWGVRALYRIGWSVAARLPERVVDRLIRAAAHRVVRGDGRHVRNLRHNLGVAVARPAEPQLVQAAMESHFRNVYEQLALPGWSPLQILDRVSTRSTGAGGGLAALRIAYAERGVVCALPHSGNWDLAGAWACLSGLPVASIAERLSDAEFAAFMRFRTGLGMRISSHADPGALAAMVEAVGDGRMVCLLADRDLRRGGLPVTWAGRSITMPAGPALVALRSGAALICVVPQYEVPDATRPYARRLVLRISPEIPRGTPQQMMQAVADEFAARIAEQPEDWHMLQRFFDRDDGPQAAAGTSVT